MTEVMFYNDIFYEASKVILINNDNIFLKIDGYHSVDIPNFINDAYDGYNILDGYYVMLESENIKDNFFVSINFREIKEKVNILQNKIKKYENIIELGKVNKRIVSVNLPNYRKQLEINEKILELLRSF